MVTIQFDSGISDASGRISFSSSLSPQSLPSRSSCNCVLHSSTWPANQLPSSWISSRFLPVSSKTNWIYTLQITASIIWNRVEIQQDLGSVQNLDLSSNRFHQKSQVKLLHQGGSGNNQYIPVDLPAELWLNFGSLDFIWLHAGAVLCNRTSINQYWLVDPSAELGWCNKRSVSINVDLSLIIDQPTLSPQDRNIHCFAISPSYLNTVNEFGHTVPRIQNGILSADAAMWIRWIAAFPHPRPCSTYCMQPRSSAEAALNADNCNRVDRNRNPQVCCRQKFIEAIR